MKLPVKLRKQQAQDERNDARAGDFAYDVFLSYNTQDQPQVRQLAERLQGVGLRVWFDQWVIKPGDDIFLQIERGLEEARTLIVCLSPHALGSEWVKMERSTVIFRDPTNAQRRFIPLLLADCELPDTLKRYAAVDYRQATDAAFEQLAAACGVPRATPTPAPEPVPKEKPKKEKAEAPAPLAVLERKLEGHKNWVRSVAVSPDGLWAASGSDDKTVKIWDLATRACRTTLTGHTNYVMSVAITPDGKRILSASKDKNISVWDTETGKQSVICQGHTNEIWSIAAFEDSQRALSGSFDQTLKLWDINSGKCLKMFEGQNADIFGVAVTKDGKRAVSGDRDGKLKYWNLETGACLATLTGHASIVRPVQITPDGRYAVSGSHDKTVKLWDLAAGVCVGTFEGHQSDVDSVAISPDGTLVASTGIEDYTVRLWDLHSGACVQVIKPEGYVAFISVAFSPDGSRLIAGGATPPTIYVYRLTGVKAAPLAEVSPRYVNAKVVLVGESGVGKSGLAHRLIEDQFVPTESTHGMQVWRLDLDPHPNPLPKGEGEEPHPRPLSEGEGRTPSPSGRVGEGFLERESLLWDLAGQEDYRLIHQLFLDETALALVLFNPQKDDPFAEVVDWLKALQAASPRTGVQTLGVQASGVQTLVCPEKMQTEVCTPVREVVKLLIAARTDVGAIKISQQKIDRFLREQGFAGYLATSAKTGVNCSDHLQAGQPSPLKRLIAEHLPWDALPWTSTPRLLRELKNAVLKLTDDDDVRLLRFPELVQRLKHALPEEQFGEADARTAVTLLANHGLVLPFQFGDLVLLQPSLLNGYAAAVIRAARAHVDEIGCVSEQAIFDRQIDWTGVTRLAPADEELLLRAMVQTFLAHSLCIAEDTPEGRQLIFPSQYRREREIPAHPEIFVAYTFTGELAIVYTTLVVRLWYSREFQRKELWRNAAELTTTTGKTVGLRMERSGEGEGTLSVFCDVTVPDELKVVLIEYVHRHLHQYACAVRRDRRYVCPNPKCGKPVTDVEEVRNRLAAGKNFIRCQRCDKKVPLIDHIEQQLKSDPVARAVLRMDQNAEQALDTQALEQILLGHLMAICGEANQLFKKVKPNKHGIDGQVVFKDNNGQPSGCKVYVHLKRRDALLRVEHTDQDVRLEFVNPDYPACWSKLGADVFLVLRDPEGVIRWMNMTAYLKQKPSRIGETLRVAAATFAKLDAPALWQLRDQYFR